MLLLGVVFIVLVYNYLDIKNLDVSSIKSNYFSWKAFLCIGFYCFSHCIRALRLYVIAGNVNVRLKYVFTEQFRTNGVNLIVPFKLGEAYRFIRFKEVFRSGFTSVNTLIIERFFDFSILAFFFCIGLLIFPEEVPEIQNTLITVMLVLLILLVTFLSLEDTMLIIHKRLLGYPKSTISAYLLKFSHDFLINTREAKKILKAKSVSILSFTILIWSFELLSLFMFFGDLDFRIDLLILLTVFIAFSSLLPNGPLGFGGVQLAFYTIFLLYSEFNTFLVASTAYTIFIFGSGILISMLLFAFNFFRRQNEKK